MGEGRWDINESLNLSIHLSLTWSVTDSHNLWFLDRDGGYLAVSGILDVPSYHGRRNTGMLRDNTPPLLLHTLKDLIQNITY